VPHRNAIAAPLGGGLDVHYRHGINVPPWRTVWASHMPAGIMPSCLPLLLPPYTSDFLKPYEGKAHAAGQCGDMLGALHTLFLPPDVHRCVWFLNTGPLRASLVLLFAANGCAALLLAARAGLNAGVCRGIIRKDRLGGHGRRLYAKHTLTSLHYLRTL